MPDFIAVGPPRTGTTWLDWALRGHVGLPLGRKETHFFNGNYVRRVDWVPLARAPLSSQRVNLAAEAPRSRRLAREARRVRDWLGNNQFKGAIRTLDRLGVFRFCFTGGPKFEPLPNEVDARVREVFRPDVEELENMTGRDLSHWKRPRSQRRSTNETHYRDTHP